jgi:hypothetical protein
VGGRKGSRMENYCRESDDEIMKGSMHDSPWVANHLFEAKLENLFLGPDNLLIIL